jgi:MYXO-CTERM domain-containing protein
VLTVGDIVDWNLLLTIGAGSLSLMGPLSGANSQLGFFGTPNLSATPSQLLFDFSTSAIEVDRLQFQAPVLFSATDFFCINGCGLQLSMGVGDLRAFATAGGSFEIGSVSEVPLPGALPLFAGVLALTGLLGWRRRRQTAAVAA